MALDSNLGSTSSPPLPSTDAPSRAAATHLVDCLRRNASERDLAPDQYAALLDALGAMRGQPLAHPLLAAGAGRGARVRLASGREVIDLVSGIGPYVFGHDDQDGLETAALAAAADVAFQGHVLPGPEYFRLCQSLLDLAGPRLEHVWLSLSGSMANENALKMIFQRRAPADRIIAFEGAFHGRTLAMAELTDRPAYREGLPVRGFVDRVPFYDPRDPDSTDRSVAVLDRLLGERPGAYAGMCFELVQGEGGFHDAPAAFFRPLMETCRAHGVSVWLDEIQTFARSRGLFAFRTLGLEDLVDVVTVGKILQGSATLFAADHRPRAKLVAGTWAGATVGMALGARILERLAKDGFLGDDGRIAQLSEKLDLAFDALAQRMPSVVGPRSGLDAMKAFVAWDGDAEIAQEIVETSLEEGVMFQTAGGDPTKIRLLPPLTLEDDELADGFDALERALRRVAARRGLPIDDRAV